MTVASAAQAAVFAHPLQRRVLLALVKETTSVAKLAGAFEEVIGRIHHIVRRLHALRLVRQAGLIRRRGRPIRLYAAAASRFFVPSFLTVAINQHSLSRELREAVDRALGSSDADGIIYDLDEHFAPRMRRIESHASALEIWRVIAFNERQRREFMTELRRLVSRYEETGGGDGKAHLLHLALAPRRRG